MGRRYRKGPPGGPVQREPSSPSAASAAWSLMSAQGSPIAAQPRGQRAQREGLRRERGVRDLVPRDRRRDRRARRRAHRVGGDDRLPVGVAGDVDEDLAVALLLAPAVVSVSGCSPAIRSASAPAASRTSSASRVRLQRRDDVDPARPAHLRERRSPMSRSMSAVASAAVADLVEVLPRRVEVEHEPVRLVALVAAGVPDVRRDAVLLRDPAQGVGVVDHRVRDVAALAARDLAPPDPLRRALGDRLLDHESCAIPLFQRHMTIGRSFVCGTITSATVA